jgi:putative DNA methylase
MGQVDTHKRKLIEVALPLEAINREAAREKSIRHGHPSTLHLWWARRPLAACRAVLFAQLVDDPSAHPDRFPTEEAQEQERQRLFRLIERLVPWEATQDEAVLAEAREEIRRSCGDNPPEVLDPFCGGGSIPLEAQRLGLVAHGSDLNPVAVLITKALIELPAMFAGQPPVHPRDGDGRLAIESWRGAQGLAEDVRYYGAWMRDEAERRIGHLYPPATLPDGRTATVIAWIWARTVTCPNPACQATMPLVRSFWLGKKKGKEAWVRPVVEGSRVRFEIGHGSSGPPVEGTVGRTGATCIVCNTPVPLAHVRSEGKAGRMGAQLMAIVAEGERQRVYLPPEREHANAADVPRPEDAPETELPNRALGFRVQGYGMTRHSDLFTNRQLTSLSTFSDLISEVHDSIVESGVDSSYADAIATYLAFAISRCSDYGSTLTTWASHPKQEAVRNTFSRQAIAMSWDYAEANFLSDAAGSLLENFQWISKVIERLGEGDEGTSLQQDAQELGNMSTLSVIATDPPYYDNVGYADLSDFFYVWLHRSLAQTYPDLFSTILTPKGSELIASPYRHGGEKDAAKQFFEQGFERVFVNLRKNANPDYPLTVFYAFKQTEHDNSGVASTGWETMLTALLHSGLAVTATWPMRTELGNRMLSAGTNALASSVVLACRPRSESAGITDRRGFLAALHAELPKALRELQQGNIAPVDLAQAAIGPGMAVFSRYAKVVEPTGETMPVRSALTLINQVLDEVLAEQEGEFDGDTRFAIKWFEQYGFDEAGYDPAEGLARATNVSVKGLEEAGILIARAGRVRLLRRAELAADWDPTTDERMPVWEVTQQLVKALWDEGSESGAADLVRRLGGLGESARDLAYRLYAICERRGWTEDALGFNALVTSWPEILRRAGSPGSVQPELGS